MSATLFLFLAHVSDEPRNLWSPSYTQLWSAVFLTGVYTTLLGPFNLLGVKKEWGQSHGHVTWGLTFRRTLHLF